MNITIDSNGNVTLDPTYNTANITQINKTMLMLFDDMKTYDETQISAMKDSLNDLYPTLVNFQHFLDQWSDVLQEVEI